MSEESAFLAAIRAAPGDLTVRGAYADWLDERGDPRAAFVRLTLSLADAASRIQELAPSLDPEWVRSLARPWPGPGALNRIGAIRAPSEHVREPHLAVAVDGAPLDVALG